MRIHLAYIRPVAEQESPWRLLRGVALLDLRQQAITRLLGVAQQHGGVGLVEDGVVHCCVAHTERALHHNHLRAKNAALFIIYIIIL